MPLGAGRTRLLVAPLLWLVLAAVAPGHARAAAPIPVPAGNLLGRAALAQTHARAGSVFVATAWAAAGSRPGIATLVVRELTRNGRVVRTARHSITLRRALTPLSTTVTLLRSGDALAVSVRGGPRTAVRLGGRWLAPVTRYAFNGGALGWHADGGDGRVSTPPLRYGDSGALALTLGGRGNAEFASPDDPTGIVAGTRISFSVWAPADSWIQALPYTVDGTGHFTYLAPVPTFGGRWRRISLVVPVLNGGLRRFGLEFQDSQGWTGTLYLADVSSGAVQVPRAQVFSRRPTAPPARAPRPLGPRGHWRLSFDDEFAGTSLDASRWSTCRTYGCQASTPAELQCYGAGNVTIAGNMAQLVATHAPSRCNGRSRPYTSGLISSYRSYQFRRGYVEERFKIPVGPGLWPAIVLFPGNLGWPPEVDLLEADGAFPYLIAWHYHYRLRTTAPGFDYQGPNFSAGFHTVGVDVEPWAISWYVDGHLWARYADPATLAFSNTLFYIVNVLSVGGSWLGDPTAATHFPAVFEIDYVRAWQR